MLSETPSPAEIMKAIAALQKDVGVVLMDMQGLKGALAEVKRCLGEEKEDEQGVLIGTGLVGKHMRLALRVDKRFRTFDDWRNYAMGAAAASMLMLTAIWWIVGQKIEEVLK